MEILKNNLLSPVGQLILSLLFLGVSLVIVGTAIFAWRRGRIRMKDFGWITRQETPIAFYACTLLCTALGALFSFISMLFIYEMACQVLGIPAANLSIATAAIT